VGIAGVVGVLVTLLAMGAGFERTLRQTGSDDTAIVLQVHAQAESGSVVPLDAASVVAEAPQVLKDAAGLPMVSPELLVVASLPRKGGGPEINVSIRGVGERVWEVKPRVRIFAGRKFNVGLQELIVGKGAGAQISGGELGSTLMLNGQPWKVVGLFDSSDAFNSEIWADTAVVASAFHRGTGMTSVVARLTGAEAFQSFKSRLTGDPRLKVDVHTTREYYNRQSSGLARLARILGLSVGGIMAVGAVLGALNTMYAAVAMRAREISTLRAVGFRRAPIVVSVLLETMLLAAAGAVLGAALAWVIFDGFTATTLGSAGQIVFTFNVSPALLGDALKWAMAIGFIGGVFPAIRAARVSVALGLREV
jgi:putative ABC transport system permease protein